MLPGVSGIELCKWLRSRQLTLPVLMLTAKDRMEEKIIGLDSGADDYLVKPFDMAELLARLRALQRRSSYVGATLTPQVQPRRLQVGCLTLNYSTHQLTRQYYRGENQVFSLTVKEFQLLEYFMRHPKQVINLEPEFIKKQDGHQKQDCENAAVKRWLNKNPKNRYTFLAFP
ncbi:hypothetical protein ANSO36C_54410 [Nostoc cf. commune SO-36]|uniref:Response regulatory domain-containing protein n=1 Tax=Nostoc cf. commune SO-36 TaxID=449208 RepID=A0ABN6QCT9_NOSCO|nr:hypothetical protein ANSO36C_54410 [Nostoc cf. commune SO-36]